MILQRPVKSRRKPKTVLWRRSRNSITGPMFGLARCGALLLNGIDDYLLQEGYFYFIASHRRRPDLLDEYPKMLMERSVEGFIVIDTLLKKSLPLPTVNIAGHTKLPGVTNLVLDHRLAARLALEHLARLGHRKIAFIKGQPFSSDSRVRWDARAQVSQP